MNEGERRALVEVCVDTAPGALAAQVGGADRVELCANLLEGGTTPSFGAVQWVHEQLEIDVMVLVRARGGDFVYTDAEVDIMIRDIETVKNLGVAGVVVGALLPDGGLDLARTRAFIEAARPLQVTFHRAFDMCADPRLALEQLVDLGVERILTSGQEAAAVDGLELLTDLVRLAGGRVSIMPGGGILESDIRKVVETSGCSEVHFAAGGTLASRMVWRNPKCSMGCGEIPGEYETRVTDAELVRRFILQVVD